MDYENGTVILGESKILPVSLDALHEQYKAGVSEFCSED